MMKSKVDIIEEVLYEQLMNGAIDLRKIAKIILIALSIKKGKDEKDINSDH